MRSFENVDGLNSITLKFPAAGVEDGYLHQCIRKLHAVWPAVITVYVLIMLYHITDSFLKSGWPWQHSGERFVAELILFCFRTGGILQGLVHIIISKSSRLSGWLGNVIMERSVIFLAVYTACACLGRYYIAKMLGHGDPSISFSADELPYTDTLFALNMFMVLSITHISPLRWCSLIVIEISTLVIYGVPVCFSWTPEPRKFTCLLNFVLLVIVASYGKRQQETNHRVVYSSLLCEKTLRAEVEFELSQEKGRHQQNRVKDSSTCSEASIPETVTTGEAFCGPSPEVILPLNLHTVFNIGKREYWLIDEKELVVDQESCLGEGGYGIVLAGEFNSSPVALKILKETGGNKSLFSIANELRLLRKLRHPNIVLFHGACFSSAVDDLVLVMERVLGVPMTSFVNNAHSSHEHLQALTGICHALIYLHTRRPAIIHGDLKPQNIMIEQRGSKLHAKILDFGLARLITRNARPGGGTLRWMSPETLAGDCRPSASSDVFSFGLITFYSATGKKPFEELSVKSLKAHIRSSRQTASALAWPMERSELSAICKPIVELATRRLPQERPSMADIHKMISGLGQSDFAEPKVVQCASNFWGSLLVARQSVLAKRKSQQHEFGRWLEKIKFVEELANPIMLTPIKEEQEDRDAVTIRSSNEESTIVYPGFAVTPTSFIKVSLVETLLTWNCSLPSTTCCGYHALVDVLLSLAKEFHSHACRDLSNSRKALEQCPVCSTIIQKERADSDVEDVLCSLCGFEGPAIQCSCSASMSL